MPYTSLRAAAEDATAAATTGPITRPTAGPTVARHRRARVVTAMVASVVAAVLVVAGCAGGAGRGGTDQPGVQGPPSVAPGPAGNAQRTSLATASVKDVQAALRTNDVDDPEHWAQVVIEARPYPAGPAGDRKLREVLTQFRADPDTAAKISNTLTP